MRERMPALAISAYTLTSCLGHGRTAHATALAAGQGGLRPNDFSSAPLDCCIGRVDGLEAQQLPPSLAAWDCRNNRLAWFGLQGDGVLAAMSAAVQRHGHHRVAVVMGTSTGSIRVAEQGYRCLQAGQLTGPARDPRLHSLHSLAGFVAAALSTAGPCLTVSTACSSSAKVFAVAARLLHLGLVDAAVVGGVDSLCDSVLFGFHSLGLVSTHACRPFDRERDGISIGEAAGFALLERADANPAAPRLIGYGESSDAHHMSTPHPDGLGASLALDAALARAGIDESAVDYLNLHGTATPKNDEVEAALLARRFPATLAASSTKGYTGHTLGAAGIVEAAICLLAIEHGFVPGNLGCRTPDPVCGPQLAQHARRQPVAVALSNSFGFGGNNACLALAGPEAPR
ncbi:MAG TPA: beta-ketoacyl-ACP synthase [Rhodanobacteraceae bacterium]|nr:beta-ketoacyl-ACP synthase [Rhodanobacteraceae bacterium]